MEELTKEQRQIIEEEIKKEIKKAIKPLYKSKSFDT